MRVTLTDLLYDMQINQSRQRGVSPVKLCPPVYGRMCALLTLGNTMVACPIKLQITSLPCKMIQLCMSRSSGLYGLLSSKQSGMAGGEACFWVCCLIELFVSLWFYSEEAAEEENKEGQI